MVNIIIFSATLIIALLLVNAFAYHLCGYDSSGSFGNLLEGAFTILFLYLLIIGLLGENFEMMGIPFADKLDHYESVSNMFHNYFSVFLMECVELISLTFVISLITGYFGGAFSSSTFSGKIIKNMVLVLIGILLNNYLLGVIDQTAFFSWAVSALQCFLSGTALVTTPAIIISKILSLSSDSEIVTFLAKKLPETKIGKALSASANNSLVMIFSVILFESQYGSVSSWVAQAPALIVAFGQLILMITGIRIMIKAVTR